jgi:exopolyphosphatase/guanosine-5'-triphosphate,3'-diphosphate pyrophosphatase
VLAANGWSDREITADGLAHLVRALVEGRWDADTGLLGLAPERVDIFPAGVALLDALFRRLGIRSMRYVDAALEDGVMLGLLGGTDDPGDVRPATVRGLQARFGIDVAQAGRVRETALALFDQADAWWPVAGSEGLDTAAWRQVLAIAADFHELGLVVAPRAYHRHGAYLLKHADLRGFSAREREYLALLVRSHRRSLPVLAFSSLAPAERRRLLRLAALLRVAVILERGHADREGPLPRVVAGTLNDGDRLVLTLPPDWPSRHPLSMRELELEPGQLAAAGIRFEIAAG